MTTSPCFDLSAATRAARRPLVLRLVDHLVMAQTLHRQRQALSRLDPALLQDIGLTAFQAEDEASRPFWNVPTHWRT